MLIENIKSGANLCNPWLVGRTWLVVTFIAIIGCKGTDDTPNSALRTPHSVVQFTDVTSEARIQFRHVHGGSGEKYFVETMGSGAAFLDYDNDGDQDFYLVQSGEILKSRIPAQESPMTNILYRNEGDGTFTDVTEKAGVGDTGYGMGVAVGDIDNDGNLDIYVTNFGPNVFYHNNGDGTFTDVTENAVVGDEQWGASAAFADVDADGYLDLYVVNFVDFSFDNNKFCGDKKKGIRSYCGPLSYNGISDILYRNNGDMTFTDVTKEAGVKNPEGKGLGVVFLDYDNDGDVDIYIANDSVMNFFYRNDGHGIFTDVTHLSGTGFNEHGRVQAGMGVDAGDFDNDGYFDLFVTNFSHDYNTLYRNNGSGVFNDFTFLTSLEKTSWSYVGWGTGFFDYDNDGDQDIFITNSNSVYEYGLMEIHEEEEGPQEDLLYENQGDGTFADVSKRSGEYFLTEKGGRGTAFGDIDNDGDLDLLVTNNNDEVVLLQNDGGNQNNWLLVKTIGTKSNRDGIGARIRVVSGDLAQVEEVRSGSSYLCQSDLRVHFGLGKRERVDRLEIHWPSGLDETFKNIKPNQLLILTEGKGIEEQKFSL
jgi:hypothetical protein